MGVFKTIAKYFHNKGYRIHVISKLSRGLSPIDIELQIINQYITERNLNNIIFLSHSKGGVISKLFLEDHPEKVRLSISMATPYQGSMFGYLWFLSLKELAGRNHVIKNIMNNSKHNHKVVNLYPSFDNHIIPNRNALLPGAKNIEISIVGHTRILESKQAIKEIEKYLEG